MDAAIQQPQRSHSHAKSISVVSSTYQGSETADESPAGRRGTKYGTGKYASIELLPQPSDSPLDPLNWPTWKKNLAFASLCLSTAIFGVLKTMLVSVNGVISTQFNVSYTMAASFTGVPMVCSAIAALVSTALSQACGKRPIYLLSSISILAGAIWNRSVTESPVQFMLSRIGQGLGWGACEALVMISIRDMYFVHERGSRFALYNMVNIIFTWGSPILGGYLSQSSHGFGIQLSIVIVAQSISILLHVFATPETSFDRKLYPPPSNSFPFTSTTVTAGLGTEEGSLTRFGSFRDYARSLSLTSHLTCFHSQYMISPVRALAAPSTVLTFLLTGPLVATTFGVASSLSLLFSMTPIFLFPSRIGFLFILPASLALVTYSLSYFISYIKNGRVRNVSIIHHLLRAIPCTVVGVVGLTSFGLYTLSNLSPVKTARAGTFDLDITGQNISLRVVSLLFGFLVAGATMLDFAGMAILSTSIRRSNCETRLESSHKILQNFLSGIFIIAFPRWIGGDEAHAVGLKGTAIGISVIQIVLVSSVAALLWVKEDMIKKFDSKVMGLREDRGQPGVPLKRWQTKESFFEP